MSRRWFPQVQALNAAGYRTITPDLPGLGQSDKPTDLAHYNMQTSVTPAMIALLDVLGLKNVTVVGHDFGSGLAWGLAFTCPDRVERLVAVSIGFPGKIAWHDETPTHFGCSVLVYEVWRGQVGCLGPGLCMP
jgi:pimeloyl-ACP methyl ester carboxylesterase